MSTNHFELRHPVSPFVCSTSGDFVQERQHISTHVFPKLDQLCRSRGSYFNAKDFQWSPHDSKTREGYLLKGHLDTIKKTSPFFIGILGETYGPHREENGPMVPRSKVCPTPASLEEVSWLDKNFILAGHSGHPWVLDEAHQASSVVELEVTQATSLCDNQHATLYFRQLEHLEDKLEALPDSATEEDRNKIIATHSPESEYAKMKIRELKHRLIKKGIFVKYFRTVEELGQMVLQDWTEIIDMVFPPLLCDVASLDSLHYNEWLAQESFCENCTRAYVSTNEIEELMQDLSEFALSCTKAESAIEADDLILGSKGEGHRDYSFSMTAFLKKKPTSVSSSPSILLLGGDRGVGKSSLVSRWMKSFKEEYPHVFILSHFVSASYASSNVCNFMYECIQRLRQHFILTDGHDRNNVTCMEMERDTTSIFSSFNALCQAFVAALSLGPCVVLLDGLNELSSCFGLTSQQVKEFDWLPNPIPSCCKMVVTTTKSDVSHRSLLERNDVVLLDCPASLMEAHTSIAMVKEHEPNAEALLGGDKKIRHLGALRVMQTALGARAISCEIVRPQVYRNLKNFMEMWGEIWSLRNFWIRSLQSWIKSYSWLPENASSEVYFLCNNFDYSGWVTDSLCFIALSRNGLTQRQILSILHSFGYDNEAEVTEYDWHQFRMAAGATLHEKGDGRIVFAHKYVQEIAEYLLFKSLSPVAHDPAAIQAACTNEIRQAYHAHLSRFFGQQPLDIQVLEETPWNLMLCGDIFGLLDFLTDCGALLKMLDHQDSEMWVQDLKFYWSFCKQHGHKSDYVYVNMMHSLGIIEDPDLELFEDTQEDTYPCWTPGPRVVISTPQELTREEAQLFTREETELSVDDQSDKEEGSMDECHIEKSLAKEPGDEALNSSFTEGIFITQNGKPHSSSLSGKMASKLSGYDNFPGVVKLGWHVGHLLKALGHLDPCRLLMSSLVKYINQNYPLTLDQHLLLTRCHFTVGSIHESEGNVLAAEIDYQTALQTLMEADEMDDEMERQNDIVYLKGVLLRCQGKIQLDKGDLFEAEDLLKEALECIVDNHDCYVLRANVHHNLGLLRTAQQDFTKAEACLRECIRQLAQWVGRFHPLVAEVYVDLARVIGCRFNSKSFDVGQAETLYREALSVRENCFGPCDISVATVLCELGELLAGEKSQGAKMEAQQLLRRSLDIRTTELGPSHPETTMTQEILTRLDVALKLGHYKNGSNRSSARRPHNAPFSAMSFRESDLSRLQSRNGSSASHRYPDMMSVRAMSKMDVLRHNRPESLISSASDRLLSSSMKERPRLLKRNEGRNMLDHSRVPMMEDISGITDDGFGQDVIIVEGLDSKGRKMVSANRDYRKDTFLTTESERKRDLPTDTINDNDDDVIIPGVSYIDSYADVALDTDSADERPKLAKKIVKIRPASAPRRMFQKFQGTEMRMLKKSVGTTKTGRAASGHSHPWSGRSILTCASSVTSGHHSRCAIPGRHDITQSNTRSISGPHSDLNSLLGDSPCPRPPSGNIHHKSAWYHVPGRYITPQQYYPKKRMQKTENAKDIEAFVDLKTQWAKRKIYEEQRKQQKQITKRFHGDRKDHASDSDGLRQSSSSFNSFLRQGQERRPKLLKSETPRLMISGLDMMPEPRYPDELVTLTRGQSHGVKFREPIAVG